MKDSNLDMELSELVAILHKEKGSCVIFSEGEITVCRDRGVKDLFRIVTEMPEILNDAMVADKVVGKGAAALLVLGKVREIYADVISRPALNLLKLAEIPVAYDTCVPHIINHTGNGICPVEALCMKASTAEECMSLIRGFISSLG